MDIVQILVMSLLIILLLAVIELVYNTYTAAAVVSPPETYREVLLQRGEDGEIHVVLYNHRKAHRRDIPRILPGYTKKVVKEHVASKLRAPIDRFVSSIREIPRSSAPISAFYESFTNGETLLSVLNPISFDPTTQYRCAYPSGEHVDAFLSNGMIYLR
jgi:hypothetical protein